jgi:hypothetical protein
LPERPAAPSDRFERHAWLTLAAVTAAIFLTIVSFAEGGLRVAGLYDPFEMNFYVKPSATTPGLYETPYGVTRVNVYGFPDEEFDLEDPRPRIGYFGDSVTFGVGTGHGHRISDHLRATFPRFQHLTFAEVGGGLQAAEVAKALRLTETFGVDRYVYLMNLNDLLPSFVQASTSAEEPLVRRFLYSSLIQFVDGLRMHSHLYNFLRTRVRNAIARRGFGVQGFEAYELWPTKHVSVIDGVTGRINDLQRQLRARGVPFCIAILPYEMQISQEAEQYYAGLGFRWEEGFIDRTTQRMVRERLDPEISVVDTYEAFVRNGARARGREDIGLGEFFVGRAAGSLDWNHPNRAGHREIAAHLREQDFCRLSQTP